MKTKKQLLHVIGALIAGGAERFTVDLIVELKKKNWDVCLFTLSSRTDAGGGKLARHLRMANIPVFSGHTPKVNFRSLLTYAAHLRQSRPSIIHLHTPNTQLAHLLATTIPLPPYRLFRTLHSLQLPRSGLTAFATRHLKPELSIACSHEVFRQNRAKLRGNFITILNGVRFDWPVRTLERSLEEKRKLELDPKKLHFVCVGRLEGENCKTSPKAHDVLIRSWKLARVGKRHAQLHILGDGRLRSLLENLASDDPSILFHGIQDEISRWLIACDCFVLPSRSEGLPVAGIEAIGTGLPVIFSDIPSLRELASPQAYWVQPNNETDLAHALNKFSKTPIMPSMKIIEEFRCRFGIARVASEYEHCYFGQSMAGTAL